MRTDDIKPNDPEDMAKAREISWLSQIFQENNLSADQKQKVLKSIYKERMVKKHETIREENTFKPHLNH